MRERLNLKKVIITSIIINAFEAIIVICIMLYNFINRGNGEFLWSLEAGDFLLIIAIITVFISSLFTIKNLYTISFIESEQGIFKSTLEQLEGLNHTLRAQRHDFINHLQVVYSLMEMDEYSEAKDYIEKIYNDIQKVNQVLKTSNPAVNALLQAKMIYCEKKGIEIKINITSKLDKLVMPSWEFCRVLGNIIDNAIYALEAIKGEKIIEIDIYENLRYYCFNIRNNGPQISEEIIHRIFDAGFTTKGENGQGMGLAITKDTIKNYGGEISVRSSDKNTEFEGSIPKQLMH